MRKRTWTSSALPPILLGIAFLLVHGCSTPTRPDSEGSRSAGLGSSNPGTRSRLPVRAAYFYSYMSLFHMDSLRSAGIERAMIKFIGDGLSDRTRNELHAFVTRSAQTGVELVPTFSLQATAILQGLATSRRYTWQLPTGGTFEEANVGCPVDSSFWRAVFLGRALEILEEAPTVRRIAVDLEIYTGSITHYIAGPCYCSSCTSEFEAAPLGSRSEFQLARMTSILTGLLAEFRNARPGVELGIFDLDKDADVHRAMIRALVQTNVPTTDYCERSYRLGGEALDLARTVLAAEGSRAPVVGGIWLKQHPPEQMYGAIRSVLDHADGYFIFTTFSLWLPPDQLYGPYLIPGSQTDYWMQIKGSNQMN